MVTMQNVNPEGASLCAGVPRSTMLSRLSRCTRLMDFTTEVQACKLASRAAGTRSNGGLGNGDRGDDDPPHGRLPSLAFIPVVEHPRGPADDVTGGQVGRWSG